MLFNLPFSSFSLQTYNIRLSDIIRWQNIKNIPNSVLFFLQKILFYHPFLSYSRENCFQQLLFNFLRPRNEIYTMFAYVNYPSGRAITRYFVQLFCIDLLGECFTTKLHVGCLMEKRSVLHLHKNYFKKVIVCFPANVNIYFLFTEKTR